MKKVILSFCFFLGLLCLPQILQATEAAQGTVIVDLRQSQQAIANKVFSFDSMQLQALKDTCADVKQNLDLLNDEESEFDKLFQNKNLSQCVTDRFIMSKGDSIKVWILYEGDKPEVNFEEIERDTQIMKDINVLMTIVPKVAALAPPGTKIMQVVYNLTKKRATLTVKVSADKKTDDTKNAALQTTITTGPKEHLFLSTDVRFTKVSQLKYDSSSKSLQEKDAPSSFYLGINYMIGDLLSKDQQWYNYLVIKGLLKISKRPQDSFGVALGYRSPEFKLFGVSLETFSPFIGVVWIKEDSLDNGEVQTDKKYSKASWVFGLSFNLDKATDWLKKK